jgi:hypothetical protein
VSIAVAFRGVFPFIGRQVHDLSVILVSISCI